jgi:16S rRNA (guanine527-N7)-methyltransferase
MSQIKDRYLPKEIEFNNLVMEWNKKINLVSRKKENVFDLIDDSRIFLDYIDFTKSPRIMDLGTGGGFPGIVVKIHHPEIKITLIDSIMKKISAVCDITSRLDLGGITSICIRAEDLGKNNVFKHIFNYVVARSVASLQDLAKWSHGLLKPGGKLITLKGGGMNNEIQKVMRSKFVKKIDCFDAGERKVVICEM